MPPFVSPPTVSTSSDHFHLFQLPVRFALDAGELEKAYRQVQTRVHPDRYAASSGAEKRVAMQWSTRANEAFDTLRSPLKRGAYLCELNDVPIEAETNTAMEPGFLMQQLDWREGLDGARRNADASRLQSLADAVDTARADILRQIEEAIDTQADFRRAAVLVRELMFVERFRHEVADAQGVATARTG